MRTYIAAVAALLIVTSGAGAGILLTDLNAMGGQWQNSTLFQNGGYVKAKVEFAVYAPGQFTKSFSGVSDPSGGKDYFYAYQIFNNFDAAGQRYLSWAAVGLNQADEQPNAIGYVSGSNTSPSLLRFSPTTPPPTSATWSFTSPTLAVGAISNILYFSAPGAPEWDKGTLKSGSNICEVPNGLPSPKTAPPLPEPGTLAILGLGLAAVAFRRNRRQG